MEASLLCHRSSSTVGEVQLTPLSLPCGARGQRATPPSWTRRLIKARRLFAILPLIPPAFKRGRRLLEGGVYSKQYGMLIDTPSCNGTKPNVHHAPLSVEQLMRCGDLALLYTTICLLGLMVLLHNVIFTDHNTTHTLYPKHFIWIASQSLHKF